MKTFAHRIFLVSILFLGSGCERMAMIRATAPQQLQELELLPPPPFEASVYIKNREVFRGEVSVPSEDISVGFFDTSMQPVIGGSHQVLNRISIRSAIPSVGLNLSGVVAAPYSAELTPEESLTDTTVFKVVASDIANRICATVDFGPGYQYGHFEIMHVPGDYTHDFVVDALDFIQFRNHYGTSISPLSPMDHNGDLVISATDFAAFRLNFGKSLPGGSCAQ